MAGTRSLRFQPAELVKIVVILLLAVLITRLGKQINEWRVWGMIAVLIGPLALLVTMNNLSSGIIICGIAFVMMFIACKRKWPFIATVVLGITVIVFAPSVAIALEKAGILHSYQLSRILVWKNPGRRIRSPVDIRSFRDCTPSVPAAFSERDWDRVSRS